MQLAVVVALMLMFGYNFIHTGRGKSRLYFENYNSAYKSSLQTISLAHV